MAECVNPPCEREATHRVKPSPIGSEREFCYSCYRAWYRGANTTFTSGVPRAEEVK